MHAINHDFPNIIEFLIKKGADVNFQEPNKGETPLMMAAEFEDPALAEVLIDNGADLSLTNKNGDTALDLARMQKEGDDVVLLLILEASSKRRRIVSAKAA
jgi:ankyrin repeat protein